MKISNISMLFTGILSFIFCVNIQADETSTTTVDPTTQESTTTTVNTDTQQATITKTNPNTGETTTVIQTPVPAPQDVMTAPTGYVNCFRVSAGWYQDVWVPEHKVCQYTSGQGVAWVDGHWICTKYVASEGSCTKWEWKKGHWVNSFEVY